jgi:flagellar basal body rod protein FlgG
MNKLTKDQLSQVEQFEKDNSGILLANVGANNLSVGDEFHIEDTPKKKTATINGEERDWVGIPTNIGLVSWRTFRSLKKTLSKLYEENADSTFKVTNITSDDRNGRIVKRAEIIVVGA